MCVYLFIIQEHINICTCIPHTSDTDMSNIVYSIHTMYSIYIICIAYIQHIWYICLYIHISRKHIECTWFYCTYGHIDLNICECSHTIYIV